MSDHQKKKSIKRKGKRPPIWIYPKPEAGDLDVGEIRLFSLWRIEESQKFSGRV